MVLLVRNENMAMLMGGTKMKGIIERFEGEFVIIEIDGVTKDFAKTNVDDNISTGDSVEFFNGKWIRDEVETTNRTKKIKKLMNDLWED
jgi:hypothetical protein